MLSEDVLSVRLMSVLAFMLPVCQQHSSQHVVHHYPSHEQAALIAPSDSSQRVLLQLCSQRWRETDEEKREIERLDADMINDVRQAAEVHRQVRTPNPLCTYWPACSC